MSRSHYEILNVSQDATPQEIAKAYRDAARVHHPDHGGAVDIMVELNEAYEVLSDPDKRADYDIDLNIIQANLNPQEGEIVDDSAWVSNPTEPVNQAPIIDDSNWTSPVEAEQDGVTIDDSNWTSDVGADPTGVTIDDSGWASNQVKSNKKSMDSKKNEDLSAKEKASFNKESFIALKEKLHSSKSESSKEEDSSLKNKP